ncbi:MAG: Wzz/FepE/Etk N-terminal domain-containing protein [Patescibacteria group bacterium]|nr:Wzz/FepE/Etk N-terminal domain-containing protein [Patescibacteria group bacterium]MCX7589558.1 Wzz/FepE/Etk N-terminal domain-containing protein [Patescibacteria group bacterium]MDW8279756.1 Wzz/FepE/Etk N-terminal domain-containing protein [bacterium]
MAIVIEENKEKGLSNLLYIVIWIVLILGILIGLYYVFFKKPEIYESTLPIDNTNNELNSVLEVKSRIDLNRVIQMTQSFKNYIDIPKNFIKGKENPFF